MSKKLETALMLGLIALGLASIMLRGAYHDFGFLIACLGFLGFPVFYAYLSWPGLSELPMAGKWWGSLLIMLLFGGIILYNY